MESTETQRRTPAKMVLTHDDKTELIVWIDDLYNHVVIETPGPRDGEKSTARLTFNQWAEVVRHVEHARGRINSV